MQDDLAITHSTSDPSSSSVTIPQRSLDRQIVLEEDEYTAALSHIIARDFFPSLVHLDARNSYLDALRSRNESLIEASVRRLQGLETPLSTTTEGWGGQQRLGTYQTPSQTPWAAGPSDTPLRTPINAGAEGEGGSTQKRKLCDADLGLDEFQARYTSEDNASFTQILDDENRRRKERFGWAWDAQRRVEDQRVKMIEGRERLMIEKGSVPGVKEKLVIEPPERPRGLLKDKEEENEREDEGEKEGEEEEETGKEVVLASEQQEQVDVMARKKDTRAAGVDGWNFKTRNAFMFAPDADVSPHVPQSASASDTKSEPKTIKYANTRLPEQNESTTSRVSEPPSPTRSRIDAAIAGTPYRPRSPTTNSFSLVPTMPSPTPSELGPAAVKQLMTWGTLNATPRIISDEDDAVESGSSRLPPPNTPFHLPPPTSREQLGHKLSNKASRSLREKAALMSGGPAASSGFGLRPRIPGSTRGSMPPPSLTPGGTPRRSEAAGALTPAARRLLDRTTSVSGIGGGNVASARRAEVMGRQAGWEGKGGGGGAKSRDLNEVRWTPSPAVKRG